MAPRTFSMRTLCASVALQLLLAVGIALGSAGADATPDQAHWKGDELVPPLPADPVARAQALARVQALALARKAPPAAQQLAPVASNQTMEPRVLTLEPRSPAAGAEAGPASHGPRDPGADKTTMGVRAAFPGIDDTGFAPASPQIAAGMDQLGMVVNNRLAFYDKCGTVLSEVNLGTFVGDTQSILSNPRIVYDAWDRRWVVAVQALRFSPSRSWVHLMVSQSPNPLGSWYAYSSDFAMDGPVQTGNFADNIDLGVDPVLITLTSDQRTFASSQAVSAKIRVFDKQLLYHGGSASWWDYSGIQFPNNPAPAFSLRCPKLHTFGGTSWIVATRLAGGTDVLIAQAPSTVPASNLSIFTDTVVSYAPAPLLTQPNGTSLTLGDCRLRDAAYQSGTLWTAYSRLAGPGQASISVMRIDTALHDAQQSTFLWTTASIGFAGLDFQTDGDALLAYTYGGSTNFLSLYAEGVTPTGFGAVYQLQSGLADYAGGGLGTPANPYRWGEQMDVVRDPFDPGVMWVAGTYASNAPTPSWATEMFALSTGTAGVLEVASSGPTAMAGFEGGPFTPLQLTYTVTNDGGTMLPWRLWGAPSWAQAAPMSGLLAPGASQVVTLFPGPEAPTLGATIYLAEEMYFENCWNGATQYVAPELRVAVDGRCDGSIVPLIPTVAPGSGSLAGERGVFVTSIGDAQLCAVGLRGNLQVPQTVSVRVYDAANGVAGALLASGSLEVVMPGETTHYVPLSAALSGCSQYFVSAQIGGSGTGPLFAPTIPGFSLDVQGLFHLTSAVSFPWLTLLLSSSSCGNVADLAPVGTSTTALDGTQNRGIYVTALQPLRVCSLGTEADLTVGSPLTARIYRATGTTRGALVAEGTVTVASAGMQFHDVPIHAVLEANAQYDLVIDWKGGTFRYWNEALITRPYSVAGAVQVRDGEISGGAAVNVLPHLRLDWEPVATGRAIDLAKPAGPQPPPGFSSVDNQEFGAYVEALTDLEGLSLAWHADIPAGSPVTARVYAATGTTRGALIAQNIVTSSGAGMRWHEVPLAVRLRQGQRYDIAIAWNTATEWRSWDDRVGLPFDVQSALRVVDGESGGNAAGIFELIELRVTACQPINASTAADPAPVAALPAQLFLAAPTPMHAGSTLRYGLDSAGHVELNLYDARGRMARTLVDAVQPAGAFEARLDARGLARGVYFARLSAPGGVRTQKVLLLE